jgi:hypothetical protein
MSPATPRPKRLVDRVGMTSGYDRAFYSGKHKRHGMNVQVPWQIRPDGWCGPRLHCPARDTTWALPASTA